MPDDTTARNTRAALQVAYHTIAAAILLLFVAFRLRKPVAVASEPGFPYSQAFRGLGGSWTKERLDAFISDATAYAPVRRWGRSRSPMLRRARP